ncbi:MAG TPA: lactonase family protein [Acetobacteraceae bacterium]|nr:lactonase family protein [Acetobacteraceae bacterium]HUB44394.1 lactonase family protein [Acetobacteraceae bacterium]
MFAYVGGYTTADRDGRGDGIHVYRIDAPGADWTHVQHLDGLANPSLFTPRPDGRVLYSVHGGRDHVSAFGIAPETGRLTLLSQMPCQGNNPVDAALPPGARHLVVANYGSGSVAVMPLEQDGRLLPVHQVFQLPGKPGPDPVQQASSHPHAAIFDPSGRYVIVPDKGFDCTFLFRFDAAAGRIELTAQGPVASRPGAAPRHCIFHPSLPVLYVNNELDSTVTVYGWNADTGALTEAQIVGTVPSGHSGKNTTAEIAVAPDGRFLYVSNRGRDDIALFSIASDGRLTLLGNTPTGGSKPRFFTLDPTGDFLFAANQDSDDITSFRVERATGKMSPTGQRVQVGSPSAITLIS